jgi:hypothetical protein
MKEVKNYEKMLTGKTRNGEKVEFVFRKAYVGHYPFLNKPKSIVYGAYVKIEASVPKNKFDKLTMIQITRFVTKQGNDVNSIDPLHPARRNRACWDNELPLGLGKTSPWLVPYKGWYVDAEIQGISPWLSENVTPFSPGGKNKPAIEWDAPALFAPGKNTKRTYPAKNVGEQFITCLIGTKKGKDPVFLGSVRWGFYVDAKQKVTFLPASPIIEDNRKPPPEIGVALSRWNESKIEWDFRPKGKAFPPESYINKIKYISIDVTVPTGPKK